MKFIYNAGIIKIVIIMLITFNIPFFSFADATSDKIKDQTADTFKDQTGDITKGKVDEKVKRRVTALFEDDFDPNEELKSPKIVFDFGGNFSLNARLLFESFRIAEEGGFEPVPEDRWHIDLGIKLWGKMILKPGRYVQAGANILVISERDEFGYNTIYPLFNLSELFFNWDYKIGKLVFGRAHFNLKNGLVFSGPLDGIEVDINVPNFNFKAFTGFTGFLGLFNPYFNPYGITSLDNSFYEESNLVYSKTIMKFNAEQARRIFFGIDFDLNLMGQHINPYFLLQFDITSLYYNLNTSYDVYTFHTGLNFEGRIIGNLYYKINTVGLFGTHPSSVKGEVKPILACAVDSYLRASFSKAKNLTFVLGYAMGTGNYEETGHWSEYPSDSDKGFWSDKYDGNSHNKFYYYGKYDGGFVLNPILSNIHSLSFKFMISPVQKGAFHFTIYASFFQTLKLWPSGPISDDKCDLNDYIVGSEIDAGFIIKTGIMHFSLDLGMFIPETAYSAANRSIRFKAGSSLAFSF